MASYFKKSLSAKTKNGRPKVPYTPAPRGSTAPCWQLAVIDPQDPNYVLCKVQEKFGGKDCPYPRLSRGSRNGSKGTTGNITEHMKKHHFNEFGPLLEAAAEKKALTDAKPTKQTYLPFSRKNPCLTEAEVEVVGGPSTSEYPPQSVKRSSSCDDGMIQSSIENCLEEKWAITDPRAKALTYKILEMIVLDNQPFSMVEDIGFTRLMNYVRSKYQIPSRSHFTEVILPNVYNHIKNEVKEILDDALAMSFTTDGWRALNKEEFISLTAHLVYPDFQQQMLVLHTKPFNDSHTSVNIGEMVYSMIDEFSIPHYKIHNIVHDNASNMTNAINAQTDFNSLPCFTHTTQLVVNNGLLEQPSVSALLKKIKSIGSHLSHSTKAFHQLEELQREMNRDVLRFINVVCTRWDSEYDSLKRVKDMKIELRVFLTQIQGELGVTLTNSDWDVLDKLLQLLQIFKQLTLDMSERYTNASIIIPNVICTQTAVENPETKRVLKGLGGTINKLADEMDTRYGVYVHNPDLMIATYLDPRYKHTLFRKHPYNSDGVEKVEKLIVNKYLEHEKAKKNHDEVDKSVNEVTHFPKPQNDAEDVRMVEEDGELDTLISKTKTISLTAIRAKSKAALFDDDDDENDANTVADPDEKETIAILKHQMQTYKDLKRIKSDEDPFDWWKRHKVLFPLISKVAARYLSSPPSSTESERTFSIGGNIVTNKRTRLLAKHTEQMIFLNSNLPNLPIQDYSAYY